MYPYVTDMMYFCPFRTGDRMYFSTATSTFVTAEEAAVWAARYGWTLDRIYYSPADNNGEFTLQGLRDALVFYNIAPGEADPAAAIRLKLKALDAKYYTTRILSNLAFGDEYAIAQRDAHEAEAIPLRAELAAIVE